MKKISKWLIILVVVLSLTLSIGAASVHAASYIYNNEIEYEILDGEVIVTGIPFYNTRVVQLVIPDYLQGYPVTRIAAYAFENNVRLCSVVLPSTLKKIGEGAFSDCTALEKMTLPNSVIEIGENAFGGCYALKSINIPKGVKVLPDYVFYGCERLTSISIPKGLTTIGVSAFGNCAALDSITLSGKLTTIGEYAFKGCTALKSITIPNSVTRIEREAFKDCTGVKKVTIGTGVKFISENAFSGCEKLMTVNYNAISAVSEKYEVYDGSFYYTGMFNNTNITTVVIGNSVRDIPENAFYGCSNLSKLTIGIAVKTIGRNAFGYCAAVPSVTLPSGLTGIGDGAFRECTAIKSVTIPNKVTYVGEEAFKGCTNVKKVTIGTGVKTIGDNVFRECEKLTTVNYNAISATAASSSVGYYEAPFCNEKITKVVIGARVKDIPDGLFYGCTNLSKLTMGTSVKTIGKNAFMYCNLLPSITLPDTVTTIKENAFSYCEKIKKVVIGTGVKTIEGNAFRGAGVTEVVFKAKNCTYAGDFYKGPFELCSGLKKITFGKQVTNIPDYLFSAREWGTEFLVTRIVIPKGVTKIGERAFEGCGDLEKVYLPNTLKRIEDYVFGEAWSLDVVRYIGSTSSWNKVVIGESNTRLVEKAVCSGVVKITNFNTTQKASENAKTKLTISATGVGLTYRWQVKTSAKAEWKDTKSTGYNTKTLTVRAIPANNGYKYRCIVKDIVGNQATSAAATLKIVASITKQPASIKVAPGKTKMFTTKAVGSGLRYQWQVKTSSSASWKNATFAGNTGKTLKVPATVARNGYQFRCRITNRYGNSVYTSAAKLTVIKAKVKTQPKTTAVKSGKKATFTVSAVGVGLRYQWQKNTNGVWSNISTKTPTKVGVIVRKNDSGMRIRCRITDANGNVVYTKTVRAYAR